MSLTMDQMFYLATGLVDLQSWNQSEWISDQWRRGVSMVTRTRDLWQPDSSLSLVPPAANHHKARRLFLHFLVFLLVAVSSHVTDGCSSRSTPKPRPPPSATPSPAAWLRPNVTFQTFACPPNYAQSYCLNGATCFTVNIAESLLYNCECKEGFVGQRCEYKNLDGSYLLLRERILLGRAGIAGGASLAVVLVVLFTVVFYVCARKRRKDQSQLFTAGDVVEVTVLAKSWRATATPSSYNKDKRLDIQTIDTRPARS